MAKSRSAKHKIREQIESSLNQATGAIVAEYKSVDANELAELRLGLKKVGCELKVIKNSLALKAVEEGESKDSKEISEFLKGQVAVAYLRDDVASGAKELLNFAKTNKNLVILGGLLDKSKVTLAEVKELAKLPSKEELLARIVGTLVAPHRGLLYVMNGVSSNLVRAISAIKDQKTS